MPGELLICVSFENYEHILLFSWPFKITFIDNLYADHVLRFDCLSKTIFDSNKMCKNCLIRISIAKAAATIGGFWVFRCPQAEKQQTSKRAP